MKWIQSYCSWLETPASATQLFSPCSTHSLSPISGRDYVCVLPFTRSFERTNEMDGVESVSFDDFSKFEVKNTTAYTCQGLIVCQQYLNFVRITSYDANGNRRVWETKMKDAWEGHWKRRIRYSSTAPKKLRRLWSPSLPLLTPLGL